MIQETWLDGKQDGLHFVAYLDDAYDYKRMDRASKGFKTGGGTMIIFRKGIEIIKKVRINKDSGLYQLVVYTSCSTRTIWLCNTYLNRGSKRKIISLFSRLEKVVPPDYLKILI